MRHPGILDSKDSRRGGRAQQEDEKPPFLLEDGRAISFYFSATSFDTEDYLPAAVFVQDYGDNRYVKKLKKEQRQLIRSLVEEAHEKEEETHD